MTKSVKNVHIHMNGTVDGMKFLKTPSHPILSRGMGPSHGLSHSYPIPLRNPGKSVSAQMSEEDSEYRKFGIECSKI